MRVMLSSLALALVLGAPAIGGDAYVRFPATKGDQVFFTSEGDLWRAPLAGGKAVRLTTHASQEIRPAVSPDGKWLAFSGSYEGPQEVYVMPVEGGQPRRLTFQGLGCFVLGWTPQGQVLFSTQAEVGPSRATVVAMVDPATLTRTTLPLADANEACVDDSGKVLFFTRLGIHMTGDNVRNYRGGAAAEVWRYDLAGGKEAVKVPFSAPIKRPMVWKDRLIVVSDKDGCDNLWSMKFDGSDEKQLTHHKAWDVRAASLGDGRVAYQQGADLRVFDLATGKDRVVDVSLTSDFDQRRERLIKKPLEFLENTAFALSGERVVLTARGQVAVAGLNGLRRVDVALPAGSRAREATLSFDGKTVFAFSDATGEQQLWRFPADGAPGGKALTSEKGLTRVGLFPAPDGSSLAHTDREGHLWLLNPASGENKLIDTNPYGGAQDVVWAQDGKTLAILRSNSTHHLGQILLHRVADGKQTVLTSDKYESHSPAFSPDGKWLYFLSERSFQVVNGSPWGDRNMGPYFDRRTKIYAIALQEGLHFPFEPKTELDTDAKEGKDAKASKEGKEGKDGKEAKEAKPERPAIQWEGLAERLFEVPLAAGNYGRLQTDGKRLYFSERDGRVTSVKTLEIGNSGPPAEVFAADVAGFDLSADGKKLLLTKRGPGGPFNPGSETFYIVEAGPKAPSDLSKAEVKLGDWAFPVVPQTEWKQMFEDAWRMHRGHFFDSRLRGLDWEAVRRKYEPLVARITDRAELNDLLGQMVGELGALHSQTRPGDQRFAQDGSAQAYLGGVFSRVATGYRLDHIYRTEAELPSEAAPLAKAGLGLKEGDVLTAVNGRPVLEVHDLAELLRNKAGQQVLLAFQRGTETLKPVVVQAIDGMRQANLRYSDWEEGLRHQVDQASHGKIGYLHLRAMGGGDINTFARDFYGQVDREGLILDVRRNNGGNIDSWVIEKLLRRAWAFWTDGQGKYNGTNMQQTFRGHLVVLVDEFTYSDGETFAAGIKALGLGPLVGRRTAGAGAWLTDSNTLVDRGQVRAAEWPQYHTKDGAWIIEGVGVAPDIEVVNPPKETYEGRDRQLETALKLLQDKLAKEPVAPLKPKGIPALNSGAE
ncbi:S41 family peptidase [Geothrix sp. PMB-07]|uniref:S41 family peptidase n=1 Tax=Geothrix sp. PMB-07 TaxID=3068640 RepID=UPI002740F479|nr:S41 family peptidase [Geothrix sp. PMB-07]WLT30800.1 S41 family peptidase [Geothrix sp. PMB-07]